MACECYHVVKQENERLFKLANINNVGSNTDTLNNKLVYF